MENIIKKLKHHKLAWIGGILLIILYIGAIFADFISPYYYDTENRSRQYQPPTTLHFKDSAGRFSLRPYVYNYRLIIDSETFEKTYEPITEKKYYVNFFVHGDKHIILGLFESDLHLFGVEEPARVFIFGSDISGRDVFSRILFGSRISLSIGLLGVFLTFTIGMFIGGLSGYLGGKIDIIIMHLCEILMSFPGFYLLLALRYVFPPTLTSTEVYILIVVILSFISWGGLARVIRNMVVSIREEPFCQAARAIGASDLRIVLRHILPNTLSYAIVSATLSIPGYILGESALSVLNLGIMEPQASWGNMLISAQSIEVMTSHPWILVPGIFIFIAVMSFNILGDGLRDASDPKTNAL
ncbi:MAG: ABC transporter permease [Candidatus Firestonebacteria bacterium]|nr:ABC transporter permease [Candidatus Firestonebacteria bacterium]